MKALMQYLPDSYENSRETVAIEEALQPEINALWAARDDFLEQLDPNTATWGLALWETAFGLTTDTSKDIATRRSKVIAAIRGTGTTTVARLTEVVQSFTPGCQVTITEVYGSYLVKIGIETPDVLPDALDELDGTLSVIMPAHLGWMYVIRLPLQLYTGFAERAMESWGEIGCAEASLDEAADAYAVSLLADEDGNGIMDENSIIFTNEEA